VEVLDRRLDGWVLCERWLARRAAWLAFGAGLLLATFTSAGIAGERVSAGSARVALAANAAATLASIVVLTLTARALSTGLASSGHDARSRSWAVAILQIAGAGVGVALVHLALRGIGHGSSHELVERPAQFVNDAVAVLAILCVVWGAASQPVDLVRVLVGASMVLFYVATAQRWHVDSIRFHGTTVQQLVGLEFTGVAIGIAVYRSFARRDS
jgi:hypothetical protein